MSPQFLTSYDATAFLADDTNRISRRLFTAVAILLLFIGTCPRDGDGGKGEYITKWVSGW